MKHTFTLGSHAFSFLKQDLSQVIACLEAAYYFASQAKLEQDIETITERLQSIDIKQRVKELTSSSLQILKSSIAKRYNGGGARYQFTLKELKPKTEVFL